MAQKSRQIRGGTHAALLALSVETTSVNLSLESMRTYLQSSVPAPERRPATAVFSFQGFRGQYKKTLPEAVRTMLPPLCSFPAPGLGLSIAVEACLMARKHLRSRSTKIQDDGRLLNHERAFMRIDSIKTSWDISWRWCFVAIPACALNLYWWLQGWKMQAYVGKKYVKPPLFLRCSLANSFYSIFICCICLLCSNLKTPISEVRQHDFLATFTPGYFCSIVSLRLGRFFPSKSSRYRCFAPVQILLAYLELGLVRLESPSWAKRMEVARL